MTWHRWAVLAALLTIGGLPAGCGSKGFSGATVTGTITVDGSPVPQGSITFTPTTKGQGTERGGTIADGKYTCKDVPLGKHKVRLVLQAGEQTIYDVANKTERKVPKTIALPPEYQAGVEKEVQAGNNVIDFTIKSKP
jgi:hypothetical protein